MRRYHGPVHRQGDIDGFRVIRSTQDKAPCAGNGGFFSGTAKPYWIDRVAPFGRTVKRSSTVLCLWARMRHCRQDAPDGQPRHDSLHSQRSS